MMTTRAIARVAIFNLFLCLLALKLAGAQDQQQVLDPAKQLEDIYTKSKTAKSALEFTELIDACRAVLKTEPTAKHSEYLTSLASWSHNRRGSIRMGLGKQFLRAGNQDQAKEARKLARLDFDAAIELDSSRWRAYVSRGALLAEELDYLAAIADFTSAIDLQPSETAAWFNRAEVQYELKNYDSALSDYQHVLEESPGDLQALTGQAHSLFQMGRFDEALQDYNAVLKMAPNNAWALANRGDVHQELANWQLAEADYRSAVEIHPLGPIYQRFAWLLATCPDTEIYAPKIARELAQKAIELDGENATNLDTLATAHAANGDFELAKQVQDQALAISESPSRDLEQRRAMFDNGEVFQQEIRRQ